MILDTIILDSALCVTLIDQTRHYYGGYYHVKVLVYCDVPIKQSYFDSDAEFSAAVVKLGTSIRFERYLEKMAVPESGIETVRSQLTQSFHKTTLAYLSVPDFAPRFVRSEFQKRVPLHTQIRSSRA